MILQSLLPGYFPSSVGFIVAIIVLINVISFSAFFLDKRKAVQGKWRIPEKVLFMLAGFGGAAGALFAMKLFRHKTRQPQFSIGIPVLLVLQILVALLIIIFFIALISLSEQDVSSSFIALRSRILYHEVG